MSNGEIACGIVSLTICAFIAWRTVRMCRRFLDGDLSDFK